MRSYSALILLIIAVVVQGCSGGQQTAQAGDGKAGERGGNGGGGRGRGGRGGDGVTVRTVKPERISIQRVVDISGSLISPDQVRVSSEVGGTIASINADLGQEVQAGQILVQLDTRELQLAVERAESSLRQTEAQLGIDSARSSAIPPDDQIASVRTAMANREDARLKLNQTKELVGKGLLAKSDLDTNETRLKVMEASVQSALEDVRALKASLQDRKASLELARKKVADASVRAPASGAIAERLVQKGEFIRENTQIATIVQLNPLRLQTAVQEKYADVIRRGLPVQFRVEPYPDELFEGRVSNISPAVTAATRTFNVEVQVANPRGRLKPGFFAKGAILTSKDENVLGVPQQALSTLAGVTSVYIVENGSVRQQGVKLGVQEGNLYEIIEGLKGDEVLAASSLNEITTGMTVKTIEGVAGQDGAPGTAGAVDRGGTPAGAESSGGNPEQGQRRGRGRGADGGGQ